MKITPITLGLLLLSVHLSPAGPLTCTRVVDGTTIIVESGEEVRLMGVDSLETVHPTQPAGYVRNEARAFTLRMVEGKGIRLEYDLQEQDQSGRRLAYVYLEDGTFLNAAIIKEGYGRTDTTLPFKYREQFSQYEKEAREQKRGLWAEAREKKEPRYTREFYMGSKNSTIYHLPHCALIRKVNPLDRKMFTSVNDAVTAGYLPCKVCKPPYYK